MENYFRSIRRLAEFHGRVDLPNLQPDHIIEFLLHLKNDQQLSSSSINIAVSAMKALYRDHLKREWGSTWVNIKLKRKKALPHVLSRDEVNLLLNCFDESRCRALFTTKYQCGLRINEVINIKPYDIDSNRNVLYVNKGKGNKERVLPMPEELINRLRKFYRSHKNEQWLFPATIPTYRKNSAMPKSEALAQSLNHISTGCAHTAFKLALAKSQLLGKHKKVVPHTLRHSYATHMLEAGASVRQVSAYLGHSSLDQTMVYLHLTEISEQKARVALQSLAGGAHKK